MAWWIGQLQRLGSGSQLNPLVVDQDVQRHLVGHVGRALQGLAHEIGPARPVRGAGGDGEDAGIDQGIADQTLGRLAIEAGLEGSAVDRGELSPGVAIMAHRTMDLRRHGERAGAGGALEQRQRVALLDPAIAVDPEIEVEAREVARQKGPRRQRLVAVLQPVAAGKVEVPLRHDQRAALVAAPGALLLGQAAIENTQRQRLALCRRAQRADAVFYEVEIAGIAAGDRDGSFRHVVRMADRPFAVACHSATVAARRTAWPSTSTITSP